MHLIKVVIFFCCKSIKVWVARFDNCGYEECLPSVIKICLMKNVELQFIMFYCLPVSHVTPVHPAVQLQLKAFCRLLHSPPLIQGLLAHSLISGQMTSTITFNLSSYAYHMLTKLRHKFWSHLGNVRNYFTINVYNACIFIASRGSSSFILLNRFSLKKTTTI